MKSGKGPVLHIPMRKIAVLLLLWLSPGLLQAQAPDTLEARRQLAAAGSDTARMSLLLQLASRSRAAAPELSLRYAREGLAMALKRSDLVRTGAFYMAIGNTEAALLQYDRGLSSLDLAYRQFLRAQDSAGMSRALSNTGAIYQRKSDLVSATACFTRAYEIAAAAHDARNMILSAYNIALTYADQQNGPKSLEYATRALALVRQEQDRKHLAMSLAAVAEAYRLVGDTANAVHHFRQAVQEYEADGDEYGVAAAYTNWALVTGDLETEIAYQLKAQTYWDKSGTEDLMVVANMGNLAARFYDLYRKDVTNGRYGSRAQLLQKAEDLVTRSIAMAEQQHCYSYLPDPLRTLSAIRYVKGDYKGAYESLERSYAISDTVFSQANKNRIATLESKDKIARRDEQIRSGKTALEVQRKLNIALVVVVALLVVIGFMLYRQSRSRKAANAALLRLNAELDEAGRLKTRFLSILSHDLRSPVARLVNFLRLQKESPDMLDKAAADDYAARIRVSAEHLLDTMESVLLWSKGQMEQFTPSPEQVPAQALFDDVRGYCEGIDGLALEFKDPERLVLHTDPEFVKTIMRNLTDNAIKAVREHAAPLIIWSAGHRNGRPALSVTDNGAGTDRKKLQALFDEKTAVIARNGLGFHLVRDMAQAIHCTIEAETQEGQGTTFYLVF